MDKDLKQIIKKEIAPLLIGIRNDLEENKKGIEILAEEVKKKSNLEYELEVDDSDYKGQDGYTPQSDVDYPSEQTVFNFIKDNLPKRGKDYFTESDIKDIIKEVFALMPSKEELKGRDGQIDYSVVERLALPLISAKHKEIKKYIDEVTNKILIAIDEDRIPELSADQIRNKLESLKGNARLDAKAIKGLEKFVGVLVAQGGGGGGLSRVATDASLTGDGTPSNPLSVVNSPETQNLQAVTDIGNTTTNDIGVNGIQFDTTPTATTPAPGLMQWNATDETLNLGMPDNITLQLGQETQIKVRNNTGSTLSNGKPVYTTGMLGNRPTVGYAKGDVEVTSRLLGLLTQDIPNNNDGKVTTSGYVRDLNTTGSLYGETWVDGDRLWVSTTVAGGLTNVEPSAPHHSDYVGQVVNAHITQGSILVDIDRHIDFQNLADVNGTPLTTDGQIATWHQTGGYFDFDKNINDYLTSFTEVDPVFSQWLIDTPPLYSFTETDPVWASEKANYLPYTGASYDLALGSHSLTFDSAYGLYWAGVGTGAYISADTSSSGTISMGNVNQIVMNSITQFTNGIADSGGYNTISLSPANRILYGTDGTTPVFDWSGSGWGAGTISANTIGAMGGGLGLISLSSAQLYSYTGSTYLSIDWASRRLYDYLGSAVMLDWSGQSVPYLTAGSGLYGIDIISGGLIDTATISVDWVGHKLYATGGVYFKAVDWQNCLLSSNDPSYVGIPSLDWELRKLYDQYGSFVATWGYNSAKLWGGSDGGSGYYYWIDMNSATLGDPNGTGINWSGRYLQDNSGYTALSWASRTLNDASGNAEVYWDYSGYSLYTTSGISINGAIDAWALRNPSNTSFVDLWLHSGDAYIESQGGNYIYIGNYGTTSGSENRMLLSAGQGFSFTSTGSSTTVDILRSGNALAWEVPSFWGGILGGSGGAGYFHDNSNTVYVCDNTYAINATGNIIATSFITNGGSSSQFVKGDGTLDSNTYLTSVPAHTYNEVPSGAIDSANTIYTTAYNFTSNSTQVYLNKLRQELGVDYTETGANQITFTTAPDTGDSLIIDYQQV